MELGTAVDAIKTSMLRAGQRVGLGGGGCGLLGGAGSRRLAAGLLPTVIKGHTPLAVVWPSPTGGRCRPPRRIGSDAQQTSGDLVAVAWAHPSP